MKTRKIGPVDVAVLDRATALASILAAIADGDPRVISFANAHGIDLARHSRSIAQDFGRILFLNDGVAIDLWSRIVWGEAFPENLNGTDFMMDLCAALPTDSAVFLVGDREAVIAAAAAAVAARFPHVRVAGFHDGFFARDAEPALAEQIRASGARLVIVGMGQPRQEQWALRTADDVEMPIVCVGAWLGFVAGVIPRAPRIVRTLRAEWLFRLAREPRRLASRYVTGSVRLAAGIAGQWIATRRR